MTTTPPPTPDPEKLHADLRAAVEAARKAATAGRVAEVIKYEPAPSPASATVPTAEERRRGGPS